MAAGRLVFSYHGDIWIANQDGTNPTRLTAHVARDSFPRFSPDGKLVAFSSNRMGNDDVFVMSASGGEPRQLTFNTTGDTVLSWSPDGAFVVFASQRGTSPWRSPLYKVPVGGGLPIAMDMDTGNTGMIKQDGSAVAFTRLGGVVLAQGLPRQPRGRHLGAGSAVEEDHAAHRREPEGVQDPHAGHLPDVGRRRA